MVIKQMKVPGAHPISRETRSSRVAQILTSQLKQQKRSQ